MRRHQPARRQQRAGFTLIELMISLTLLAVVMSSVIGVVVSMQRGYVRQREVAQMEDALRVAELTTTALLRSAGANARNMTGAGAPRLEPLAPPFDTVRVVSDFNSDPILGLNPADGDVTDPLEDVMVWALADTLFVRWQPGQPGVPVAYPVRSLLFQYDSAGTVLTTRANVIRAATRVRITLTAPRHSRTTALATRESWVYLRNRR